MTDSAVQELITGHPSRGLKFELIENMQAETKRIEQQDLNAVVVHEDRPCMLPHTTMQLCNIGLCTEHDRHC